MALNIFVIVGNGLDIMSGYKTKYTDFNEWLIKNKKKTTQLYEQIDIAGEWVDVEAALGSIKLTVEYTLMILLMIRSSYNTT